MQPSVELQPLENVGATLPPSIAMDVAFLTRAKQEEFLWNFGG